MLLFRQCISNHNKNKSNKGKICLSFSSLFPPPTYTDMQIILYNLITWSMLTKYKLHAPSCSTTDKLLKKHLKIWLKTDIFLLDNDPVFLIFPMFLLCQVLPWSLCEPQKVCFLQGSPTAAGNILLWIAQHKASELQILSYFRCRFIPCHPMTLLLQNSEPSVS